MKKILIIFLFYIYLFGGDNVTIQLNWKYQFEFAGFIIAKEKGYYKEAGLNVTLKELSKDSSNIVEWVNKKEGRYGVGSSALFAKIIEGNSLELLMPLYDRSPLVLTAVNLPSVKKLKDIKSQKVIVGQLSLQEPAILAMLKSQDIPLNSLHFQFRNFYNNISKPAVYAFYISNEIYTLKKNKIPYKIFDPKDYGFNFYGDILFTSKKEATNHPDRVKKVINATKRGYIYAFNHIDETINIILKKYNTQHFSREKLEYEAHVLKDYISKTFTFNKTELETIKNMYLLLGKKPLDLDKYIFYSFKLTNKEIKFLQTHHIKAITTVGWEPFNLIKNGKISGIAVDYWKYIKDKANINASCLKTTRWSNVLRSIKNKTADITCSTTITEDRKKYAIFSKPYVEFPIVIATRNDVGFISDIGLIRNKILAVGKNYTAEKLLKKWYPNLKLVEVKNTDEALKLVSEGKVYGAVDILPVIAYKINKYQFVNLKISGKTPWLFKVRFMVRNDYPELVNIINKMIDSMTPEKKEEIYRKWISVKYEDGYDKDYVTVVIIIAVIIILIFVLLILVLLRNIKNKSKVEMELKALATMDKLTSIFNRYKIDMALDEQIEVSKRYHRALSLIFFDIDHFKEINDTYGHKMGDLVLIELSKLITQNIRSSDIFGRWGGEEFLIILPETDIGQAIVLAEKLRKIVENHNFGEIKVTCSFGVTSVHEDDSVSNVIERVDKALYASKQNGRNRVTYEANGNLKEVKF